MVDQRACVRTALMAACLVVGLGCDGTPDDRTPAGALLQFIDAMDKSSRDPRALEDAYRLLAPQARDALAARAARAESLGGREMQPWEMIAQDRFRMRAPLDGPRELTERIDGDRATVVIPGEGGRPAAEIPMVKEADRWRVHLDIPPVTGE
jgi:hypothetical protein